MADDLPNVTSERPASDQHPPRGTRWHVLVALVAILVFAVVAVVIAVRYKSAAAWRKTEAAPLLQKTK